jgi:hypothetical protein
MLISRNACCVHVGSGLVFTRYTQFWVCFRLVSPEFHVGFFGKLSDGLESGSSEVAEFNFRFASNLVWDVLGDLVPGLFSNSKQSFGARSG